MRWLGRTASRKALQIKKNRLIVAIRRFLVLEQGTGVEPVEKTCIRGLNTYFLQTSVAILLSKYSSMDLSISAILSSIV